MYRYEDNSPIEPKRGFVFDEFKQGFVFALCIVGLIVIATMPFWAPFVKAALEGH